MLNIYKKIIVILLLAIIFKFPVLEIVFFILVALF